MNALVEMPKFTSFKYEFDKFSGFLKLDRALDIDVPHNYGFILNTQAEDGDELDAFILTAEPIAALTEVPIEVVGALLCTDNGVRDDKVIAVIKGTHKTDIDLRPIVHYLTHYKTGFVVQKLVNEVDALALIKEASV